MTERTGALRLLLSLKSVRDTDSALADALKELATDSKESEMTHCPRLKPLKKFELE
jgi:hypothetical protein